MEVSELVSAALSMFGEDELECDFKDDDGKGGQEVSDESIADDDNIDWDDLPKASKNNADKLGGNLIEGTKGEADSGPYEPTDQFLFKQPQEDTKRSDKSPKVKIAGFKPPGNKSAIPEDEFPFTVAAHHIIPGKAAGLAKNAKIRAMLRDYMDEGCTVEGCTIKYHIGYDVNGSHNGIWLPGWYAIRNVQGMSWSDLGKKGYADWQLKYIAAVCKKSNGQFHDTHSSPYSESVQDVLTKLHLALVEHQKNCKVCEKRGKGEIPPPFRLKHRLYFISKKIRGFITGHPTKWKSPWWTSDSWSEVIYSNGKISQKFLDEYENAK